MTDEVFIKKYEELLDKGYCNCNEMNCLDNDTPRRILNIVKGTKLEAKQLLIENEKRKEVIDKAKELINNCIEQQLENDYLMNRTNLANYNNELLDILKEVK